MQIAQPTENVIEHQKHQQDVCCYPNRLLSRLHIHYLQIVQADAEMNDKNLARSQCDDTAAGDLSFAGHKLLALKMHGITLRDYYFFG